MLIKHGFFSSVFSMPEKLQSGYLFLKVLFWCCEENSGNIFDHLGNVRVLPGNSFGGFPLPALTSEGVDP